jgi:hypothetical protein
MDNGLFADKRVRPVRENWFDLCGLLLVPF